jgi:hypothetical protein
VSVDTKSFSGIQLENSHKEAFDKLSTYVDALLDIVNLKLNSPYTSSSHSLLVLYDTLDVLASSKEIKDLDLKVLLYTKPTYQKLASICTNFSK